MYYEHYTKTSVRALTTQRKLTFVFQVGGGGIPGQVVVPDQNKNKNKT